MSESAAIYHEVEITCQITYVVGVFAADVYDAQKQCDNMTVQEVIRNGAYVDHQSYVDYINVKRALPPQVGAALVVPTAATPTDENGDES